MRTSLKIIAVVLFIVWFVSVFIYALGKLLHLLLVLAVIALLLSRRRRRKRRELEKLD